MEIPKDVDCLGTCFYSASDEDYGSAEEWVANTVKSFLRPERRKAVWVFFDKALDGTLSDEQLLEIWQCLDSDYWLGSGADARIMCSLIHDAAAPRQ